MDTMALASKGLGVADTLLKDPIPRNMWIYKSLSFHLIVLT